ITATGFAYARAAEISVMLKAVAHKSSSSQFLQSLPSQMRRRAMSQKIKRLPRRLREFAKKEVEKVAHLRKEQSKSKSRKARRRHANLMQEFNRRQRKNIWLETHIWHAKRFHVVKKWGYCLGDKPTAKSYRACYRAMIKQCLLQDLSYYCCLELMGTEAELLKALMLLTSREAGTTFAAVACLSGKCQGSLVLYKANQYPKQPLGPITFLWRPVTQCEGQSGNRQLWIWTHPALKMDVLTELQLACQCLDIPVPEPVSSERKAEVEVAAKDPEIVGLKRKREDKAGDGAVPEKIILGDGTRDPSKPVSWRSLTTGIVIQDLTMEILRYRLIGPLSHCVLFEALQAAAVANASEETEEIRAKYWSEYCRNPENVALHGRQGAILPLLPGISSPAEIPAGTVLGLTVGDPRLKLPQNKTTARPDPSQSEAVEQIRELCLKGVGPECAQSLLWDHDIRSGVTQTKISEQELNRLRSKLLVPGTQLDLGPQESKIPLLLVQQPGKLAGDELPGWGSGWDILIPKGWGMAFWIPLIYRGARVGGLQEGIKHSQSKGTPHFPDDFPDCPASIHYSKECEKEKIAKYKRYPPAKRPNYVLFGTMAPFRCPWQLLVEEWEMRSEDHDVKPQKQGLEVQALEFLGKQEEELTEKVSMEENPSEVAKMMDIDSENITDVTSKSESENVQIASNTELESGHFYVIRNRKLRRQVSAWCRPTSSRNQRTHRLCRSSAYVEMTQDAVKSINLSHPRLLIWIRVSLLKKGSPVTNATICIPSEEDLKLQISDPHFCGPQEPKHSDPFKQRCKRLKKKQKMNPKNVESAAGNLETKSDSDSGPHLIQGLWPEPLQNLTSHCSRLIIGFVTQGDFSLAVGCGEALGYVSLTGLLHMVFNQPANKRGLVLVRNPASLQYRLAKINIEE
ncbi:ribonucleases P/MRP protein subunit POP1, partial [Callorhinchus milii]|uniref:ribonucleases P/MRP protein subunit POP1 n=1 Tax=Callorhinchus milii TaxID=7868 RepID=UPI001C3F6427